MLFDKACQLVQTYSHPHRRKAVTAVLVVVLLPVLFGMATLAIDVGYLYNLRADLQHVADSASMAGASALELGPTAVRARVREIASKYNGIAKVDLKDEDILLGKWDQETQSFTVLGGGNLSEANAVRVVAQMSNQRGNAAKLFFASILGESTTDVSASATASFGSFEPWNVVITQDVTASFGEEINDARLGDQDLLDCIQQSGNTESQVALVTFTGFGKIVCPLKYIGENYAPLATAISKIAKCGTGTMPVCSGTNIGAGLDAAITVLQGLDSDSQIPPSIVLVSDGQPASSTGNPGYTDAELAQWAVDSADHAAELGYSIYTVFYSAGGTNDGEDFLANLVRGIGTAHATPDPSEISEKLQVICKEGLKLMLVQ